MPGTMLTTQCAASAVYFDFEQAINDSAPSLLGWLWDSEPDDPDAPLIFRQSVLDERLALAAGRAVPMTGGTAICIYQPLEDALSEIDELLESENRLLVSWSTFDSELICRTCRDDALANRLCERYVDGKHVAKRWLREFHPGVAPKSDGWGGKHNLPFYLDLIELRHPLKYGKNVASKGIRKTRDALQECGSYAGISKKQRDEWRAVLGHNYWDCWGLYRIVMRAAADLDALNHE